MRGLLAIALFAALTLGFTAESKAFHPGFNNGFNAGFNRGFNAGFNRGFNNGFHGTGIGFFPTNRAFFVPAPIPFSSSGYIAPAVPQFTFVPGIGWVRNW